MKETANRYYLHCQYLETMMDDDDEMIDGIIEVRCFSEEKARDIARRIHRKWGFAPAGRTYIDVWECEWEERGMEWREKKLIKTINLDYDFLEEVSE